MNPEQTRSIHRPYPASAGSYRTGRLRDLRRLLYRYFLITTMLFAARNNTLCGQQMTTQAPPPGSARAATVIAPEIVQQSQLPDDPSQAAFPTARVVQPSPDPDVVTIESRGPQSYQGGIYKLDKDVVITWKDRRAAADHIEYDSNTGDLTMTGNVVVTGGANHERILASHGTYNLKTATGRFYDVSGSYRVQPTAHTLRTVFTTDSPFLFTGRIVIKTAPESYEVYDGTFTSCTLPDPDWIFSAAHISMDDQVARAHTSTFHLLNVPVLFLPYVTHPTNSEERQSGFMIPIASYSNQKGIIIGEEVYFAINRSVDLRIGAAYYSSIGWAQNGTLRYRGQGLDFATLHYSAVLDRRSGTLQQGGQEVVLATRHDLSDQTGGQTRVAANIDYLSSYIYREAFSDTFNQAVTSDIVSTAYFTHEQGGFEAAALADRYQGIKVVATPQQQVHIFHAPTLLFDSTEHLVPDTASPVSKGVEIAFESSASGLKRTQPNFVTGGIVERIDLRPQASYPMQIGGWDIVPTMAGRETLYSRSRQDPFAQASRQPRMRSLVLPLRLRVLARSPPARRRAHLPSDAHDRAARHRGAPHHRARVHLSPGRRREQLRRHPPIRRDRRRLQHQRDRVWRDAAHLPQGRSCLEDRPRTLPARPSRSPTRPASAPTPPTAPTTCPKRTKRRRPSKGIAPAKSSSPGA